MCELVFDEMQNALPLLEKLYGPLTLDHDPDFRHITVIVRPRLSKCKFRLLQFIRDLFSPVSIAKYLYDVGADVKIVAVHGSSSDVKQSSFKDAALKQKDKLDTNTGEVILRFPDGVDESAILHDLTSAKHNLKTIFNHHKLKFISVQKGSIKFRFTLPGQSDTFDSLAMERRIREFVRDLCSYESFRQLTKREDVQLEFVCKAKLDTISVIQAQNLVVQIGNQNNVYISDHQAQSLNDRDDDESLELSEERQERGDLVSFNIVSISPRGQAVRDRVQRPDQDDDIEDETDPYSRAISVVVKCDEAVAISLHEEWTNLLPLIRRTYPNCQLSQAAGRILWKLHPRQNFYPDVTAFINDLFLTNRLARIRERNEIQVDVPISSLTAYPVLASCARHRSSAKQTQFTELIQATDNAITAVLGAGVMPACGGALIVLFLFLLMLIWGRFCLCFLACM